MSGPAPVEPAAVAPAKDGAAPLARVRSSARRWAVRLDSTALGDLWARLLEVEFVDRSVALAAKLFVSFFPMLVVVAAASPAAVREQMLDAMRSRLGVDGPSMDLIRQAFATPEATKEAAGFFGILLTVLFGVSFTTALQRAYLRAWRRPPGGGVRNKGRGALWVGAVLLFFVLIAAVRSFVGAQSGTAAAWIVSFLAGTALWWWTARLMVRGEVRWRALLPTAVITAAGCSLYAMESDLWMPTTFRNNFGQFGTFGIALSMVTFFTGVGFIIVVAAAVSPVLAERGDRVGTWLRAGNATSLEPGAEAALPGPGRRVRLADAFGRGNKGWGVAPQLPRQGGRKKEPAMTTSEDSGNLGAAEGGGNLGAERTPVSSGGDPATTKAGDAVSRAPSTGAPTATGSVGPGQRWLARLAFVAITAAFLVLIPAEGPAGLRLVLLGMVGAALFLAGGFWFLAKRGAPRWLGLAVAVLAVAGVVIGFLRADAIVWALASVTLLLIGGAAARHALRHTPQPWMPATAATAPAHAFIVMNPRSGGGKVVKFGLQQKAEELGAEVALLDGPGYVDVGALVRAAADRGADVLGVAGGDGTQALVAGIAAERDIPLLVISAGTRNHFALDLGLDREDPASCLQALTDGEEVRVDLGMIGDRPFVNNASFGAYAEIVQSPEYRDNKNRTMLDMLPDLLSGRRGTDLTARVGDRSFDDLQAVLVSNNPYGAGRMLDLARRPRIDDGTLGVLAVKMNSAGQAVSLLRRARYRGVDKLVADGEVVIDANSPTLPVGIDGEAVIVPTPVHCSVRPRALRVLLPRDRPGVPPPRPRIDWTRLWHIAAGHGTKKE